MVLDFVRRNYFPNRMVISSVGDIAFDKLVRLVEKYFAGYESGPSLQTRVKPEIYTPRFVELDKDTHQCHCIIGNIAYDYTQDNRLALSLLINLLGGAGMNTRLNLNIRVDEITSEVLLQVAKDIFDIEKQSILLYK